MPHQVLARKWRPRTFEQLVGQSHTREALTNALRQQRLHHAYLFTGTRGVGKTTIARILAKCLNCEQGVTAAPCGQCGNCQALENGRFVDLIEVDAASRTKVDDTRELLDNAQYAPTQGRYKTYLIDEVHMLSTHSFNALLKTLEEPPEHVKFLLATTDPHKLPVTVLSRCLQFNLKLLSEAQIADHLAEISGHENVQYQQAALDKLARAAKGSLRDALSLFDQAIAFCQNNVTLEQVQAMLGEIDPDDIAQILRSVMNNDLPKVLEHIQHLADRGADFYQTLDQLADSLHRLALIKHLPQDCPLPFEVNPGESEMANALSAECIQLYYQIALQGKRDLPQAPSARSGFEMIMLRLLAFQPYDPNTDPGISTAAAASTSNQQPAVQAPPAAETEPASQAGAEAASTVPEAETTAETRPAEPEAGPDITRQLTPEQWPQIAARLNLSGLALQAAKYCELFQADDETVSLTISQDYAPLASDRQRATIEKALNQYLNSSLKLTIKTRDQTQNAPADIEYQAQKQQQEQAQQALDQDSQFQELINTFDGQVKQLTPRESS